MYARMVLKTTVLTLVLLVVLLLSGCAGGSGRSGGGSSGGGGGGNGANGSSSSQPTADTAQDTPVPPTVSAQPNVISGTTQDTQGHPLQGVDIFIEGITAAGEQVHYDASTDANGAYSVTVAPGNYYVHANVSVNFENVTWSLPLDPTDGSNQMVDPSNGITKDFAWKLQGQVPDSDGTHYTDYYGAALTLNLSILSSVPAGSTFTFTLTPNGALIDGSVGHPLPFQRTVEQINTPYGGVPLDQTGYLSGIPIGDYTISGQVTAPDGTTQTVLFDGNQTEELSWAGKSEPSIHSVDPLPVNLSVGG